MFDWYPMRRCYPDYIYRHYRYLGLSRNLTGDFRSNVGERGRRKRDTNSFQARKTAGQSRVYPEPQKRIEEGSFFASLFTFHYCTNKRKKKENLRYSTHFFPFSLFFPPSLNCMYACMHVSGCFLYLSIYFLSFFSFFLFDRSKKKKKKKKSRLIVRRRAPRGKRRYDAAIPCLPSRYLR